MRSNRIDWARKILVLVVALGVTAFEYIGRYPRRRQVEGKKKSRGYFHDREPEYYLNVHGRQRRLLYDSCCGQRRPRGVRGNDVAMRTRGQSSMDDDLVSIEIEPLAGWQR